MTLAGLITAVAEECLDAVKEYRLTADGAGLQPVTVFEQEVPEEVFDHDDTGKYHPLMCVALTETTEEENMTEAEIVITIATYSEEVDGWKDLINLTDVLLIRFLKHRLLKKKYRLTAAPVGEILVKPPVPFRYAYVTMRYALWQVQEERGK